MLGWSPQFVDVALFHRSELVKSSDCQYHLTQTHIIPHLWHGISGSPLFRVQWLTSSVGVVPSQCCIPTYRWCGAMATYHGNLTWKKHPCAALPSIGYTAGKIQNFDDGNIYRMKSACASWKCPAELFPETIPLWYLIWFNKNHHLNGEFYEDMVNMVIFHSYIC